MIRVTIEDRILKSTDYDTRNILEALNQVGQQHAEAVDLIRFSLCCLEALSPLRCLIFPHSTMKFLA